MKVGDLVKQGDGVIKFKGAKAPNKSRLIGIIIEIHDLPDELKARRADWAKVLGRTVDVLWANGKLTTGFAEHSLDVISEGG